MSIRVLRAVALYSRSASQRIAARAILEAMGVAL